MTAPYTLRDYQEEGVRFARERCGTLFAVDLGLGKTAMAIAASEAPIAVVCPASAIPVWEEELALWGLSSQVLRGGKPHPARLEQVDAYIITYQSAKWITLFSRINRRSVRTVILDEAHYLQKKGLKWTQQVKTVGADRVLLLTATPIRNRLRSFYSLLDTANPRAWGYFHEFRERYCGAVQGEWGLVDTGPTHIEELQQRLTETAFVQNWGDPRLAGLRPELRRHVIDTRPGRKDRARIVEEAVGGLGKQYTAGASLVLVDSLRQKIGLGKVPPAMPIIQDLYEKHKRIVVWFWYKKTLDAFKAALPLGIPVDVVTGSTTAAKRERITREWKHGDPEDPRLLLATEASFSAAVSLTTAEAEVFLEFSYSPLDLQQAEKRVHRPGSPFDEVHAYYVRASQTVEDRILNVLLDKVGEVEEVFGREPQTLQIVEVAE